MSFFEELLGFPETTGEAIRAQLRVDGTQLTSLANDRTFTIGTLTTPSLGELRGHDVQTDGLLRVREVVDDVQSLHRDPANAGAFFQVASQFNLLEMAGPSLTPEAGVGIYEHDQTQGPACAIACGAGTIYRNWLVPINGRLGQTASRQIDCLEDLGFAFGDRPWEMVNGYALATSEGLKEIASAIDSSWGADRDELMEYLRIGIHADTEVTLPGAGHLVTQAYCSALPVAYSEHRTDDWEPFARLVLDASYEATMRAAALHAVQSGNRKVFLTLIGDGAFGNPTEWIIDAMDRAFGLFANSNLDISIVSYGASNASVQQLLR